MPRSGPQRALAHHSRCKSAPGVAIALCLAVLVAATSAVAGGGGVAPEQPSALSTPDHARPLDLAACASAPRGTMACDPLADPGEGEAGADFDGDDQDPAALGGAFDPHPSVVLEDHLRVHCVAGDARPSVARVPLRPPRVAVLSRRDLHRDARSHDRHVARPRMARLCCACASA